MADKRKDFSELMRRVSQGEEPAFRELLDQYGPHLLRVIRRKLDRKLRQSFDSADFLQDVWKSFLTCPRKEQPFSEPDELVAFLAEMAVNKVVEAFRARVQAQKRTANREESLEETLAKNGELFVARQPTPSQVAVAKEQWDLILERQPARYRAILILLRQGNTHQEIARQLGLHQKTVQRLIRKVSLELAS
jgi:RNA polymerase sigma factor (sigma-70 family)